MEVLLARRRPASKLLRFPIPCVEYGLYEIRRFPLAVFFTFLEGRILNGVFTALYAGGLMYIDGMA